MALAPITTVLPLIETESPNPSFAAPSDAVSLAVWVHGRSRTRENVGCP